MFSVFRSLDESRNPVVRGMLSLVGLETESLKRQQAGQTDFERILDEHHVVANRTRSKEADVFRFLRTQVLRGMAEHGLKTIAITSPRYGDGKTTTVANLAVGISQDVKQTTLVVDLDFRKPSLAAVFGIEARVGLTDYLAGRATVAECLVRPPLERLSVFPAGHIVDQSSETLGAPQMGKLAQEMKERYDDRLVIYDMPPLLEQDDPLVFLPHVDGLLLVVRQGVTTSDDLKRSLDILSAAKVLGVVMNDY